MGRLNAALLRYLEKEDWRLLSGVEQGMRNHEIVPLQLIASIAKVKGSGAKRRIGQLLQHKLLAWEKSGKAEGYRLTTTGYDFLALRGLQESLASLGSQLGVGKESDVYVGEAVDGQPVAVKFHRLGRTSFRKVKEKRDYHGKRRSPNWLYLSRLAATREAAFMRALGEQDPPLPVPRLYAHNRHVVVMSLVPGYPLHSLASVADPGLLFDELNQLILRLANLGLIHSDFNEFNLLIREEDAKAVLIDFPQIVSTAHANARFYFERDVQCIRDFFRRRFDFEGTEWVRWEDVEADEKRLDVETAASGWLRKELAEDWDSEEEEDIFARPRRDSSFSNTEDEEEDGDEAPELVPKSGAQAAAGPAPSHLQVWLESQFKEEAKEANEAQDSLPEMAEIGQRLGEIGKEEAEEAAESDESEEAAEIPLEAADSIVSHSTIHPDEIRARLRSQGARRAQATTAKKAVRKGARHGVKLQRRENAQTARDSQGWMDE